MKGLLAFALVSLAFAVGARAETSPQRLTLAELTPRLGVEGALPTTKNYTSAKGTFAQHSCPPGYYAYWCPRSGRGYCCPNNQICNCHGE